MNELDQLYQQIILDHAKQRHGEGKLDNPHAESFQVNPTCGDQVRLEVRLDGDDLGELAWEGQGCSISQASISVMNDLVADKSLEEIAHLAELFGELMESRGHGIDDSKLDELGDASAFVGVSQFPARIKCALLGWMALKDATLKARGKESADE